MRRAASFVVAFVVAVTLAGCGPNVPLTVSTIQLGKTINSDDSVGTIVSRFKPDDTVYAAVLTEGEGAGSITARWKFGSRTMSEETKDVSFRESAATEFHIRYAGGFPPGAYSVEFEIDGKPAGMREFRVER
jgi:hypothetical protein